MKKQVDNNKNDVSVNCKEIDIFKNKVNKLESIGRAKNLMIFGLEDTEDVNKMLKEK